MNLTQKALPAYSKDLDQKYPHWIPKRFIRVALDSNVFVPEGLNADKSFFLPP